MSIRRASGRCSALVVTTLVTGCGGPADSVTGETHVIHLDIPVTPNRDVDILFVIDDSPGGLELQQNIKDHFPSFINVLDTVAGGLPNIHLGVASSDLGTKGADDASAGPGIGSGPGSCSGNGRSGNLQTNGTTLVSGTFISDIRNTDGTRTTNYSGQLADAFSAIASLGASGCGFEQPIEAAKRALNNNPANAGFIRQDANLAIMFVQDEDDCSFAHSTLLGADTTTLGPLQSFRCNRFGHVCTTGGADSDAMNSPGVKSGCSSNESSPYLTKVGDYVTFFKGLKADPSSVVIASISGPATPYAVELRSPPGGGTAIPAIAHSCSYPLGGVTAVADPGVRMQYLVDKFPGRSMFSTICQQDQSGALTQFGQLIRNLMGSSCFYGQLEDVDPTTPGDQYECSVSDVRNPGKANQSEVVLPACNNAMTPASSTNKPCWSIQVDLMSCAVSPSLALIVERNEAPSADTHVIADCVSEP